MIDQKTALELFEYRDGALYWRVKPCRRDPIGMKAGWVDPSRGYSMINYLRKRYYGHRIIYLMHNGYLPKEVDHIDGDKTNNRIENLRTCTHSQNGQNKPAQSNNKSGVKNVVWSEPRKKWVVYLTVDGKNRNFGGFEDLELAALMASEVRDKYHGAFANHG
jgi:hypothetical protein